MRWIVAAIGPRANVSSRRRHINSTEDGGPAVARKTANPFARLLDPIDRISEILFGLIMVLTSTATLSVVTAGRADVKTMVFGALGCNLAWGIIDAGLYLLDCLSDRARGPLLIQAVRKADKAEGTRLITETLPENLVTSLSARQIEALRQKAANVSSPKRIPRLVKEDFLSALAIAVLVFLSTFPVVIPFFLIGDTHAALRTSNVVAIAMLFACGYSFAACIGSKPWTTGLVMVGIGCALTGVAILLGG